MQVSRSGGVDPTQSLETGAQPAAEETGGVDAPAQVGAVRNASAPPAVVQAVRDYEREHGVVRDVPDFSGGGVVSSERTLNGGWTVTMGSFPTTIAGPLPGMNRSPRDLKTYDVRMGEGGAYEVTPASAGPADGPKNADATKVETAMTAMDLGQTATKAIIDVGRPLVGPGLGFPMIKDGPQAAVDRFKGMLDQLEKDGRMGDAGSMARQTNSAELGRFGGRRPMDWYGSGDVVSALVNKFGSASQKAAFNAAYAPTAPSGPTGPGGPSGPTKPGGPPATNVDARTVEHALDSREFEPQKSIAATKAAVDVGRPLVGPGLGFPSVKNGPQEAVDRFKAMLQGLGSDGRLGDLGAAAKTAEEGEIAKFPGGRRPMDWYGTADVLSALVNHFGTDEQKAAFNAGRTSTDPAGPGTGQPGWVGKMKDFVASEVEQGELDNDLETANYDDLPAPVKAQFDAYAGPNDDGDAVAAYRVDVDGHQGYLVANRLDEHTDATLFDTKGKKLGSGSWDADDSFNWDR